MILFISGLPGSGKSTTGSLVAKKLGWRFVEADNFLTKEMRLQIQKGQLLTPRQLDLWVIDNVIPSILELEQKQPIVVAGMLAEKKYAKKITEKGLKIFYINLLAPYQILKERITSRDHFAQEKILNECWNVRERFILPGPNIDATQPLDKVVEDILTYTKEI